LSPVINIFLLPPFWFIEKTPNPLLQRGVYCRHLFSVHNIEVPSLYTFLLYLP
jgi:hypothetical protein